VAVVAGGGDDAGYIREAEAAGCDTYLAGHWWTPHQGEWCDSNRAEIRAAIAQSEMNFLSASHDGSELVVFRDCLAPLVASWGLEPVLIRQLDHWR
jgi:putative NIF3 family GTP cyclohydrolase 1 type 2